MPTNAFLVYHIASMKEGYLYIKNRICNLKDDRYAYQIIGECVGVYHAVKD